MIDAVCARIVMTYITSESPVTENLWSQKQRAAVAKELHIDEEKVEHLFKFICAEANRRRHTSRFTLGSERSSMNSNTNDAISVGLEDEDEDEESKSVEETGGTRIGQMPLTLDSCHALGRGVLMCGPMWKNKPSMLGSGSQIMRQVWLRPGYLAYTSGKITNHKDDSVRLIKLSDIDSVRVVLPFSFFSHQNVNSLSFVSLTQYRKKARTHTQRSKTGTSSQATILSDQHIDSQDERHGLCV